MSDFSAEADADEVQRISLYPIAGVTGSWQDEPFDTSALPAQVIPDVHIEDVSSVFRDDTWDFFEREMGKRDVEALRRVKYAIVHRYWSTQHGTGELEKRSSELMHNIAACLRLIRPMRQYALVINGPVRPDGTLHVRYFDHPVHLIEIPNIQKGFLLRNRDVEELKTVAVEFLKAMTGEYWKFRMPVSLYEAGHFQDRFWKARFFLWSSAIEAIFTSQTTDREHSGSKVAKARVKWFLGANTKIYAPGDVPSFAPQPEPTIGEVLDDVYEVRNCVAHGDKVPDRFFSPMSNGYETVNRLMVLEEAASFIVRVSLLKILKDCLLEHFRGGPESQQYFRRNGLVRSQIP
jgi:hypothetical protein